MKGQHAEATIEDLKGRRNFFRAILAIIFAVDLACILTLVYFLMNGKPFSSLTLLVVPLVGTTAVAAPLIIQLGLVSKQLAAKSDETSVKDPRSNLQR